MMDGINFNLPPDKMIKLLESKKIKVTFDYKEMMENAHEQAFTVSKAMSNDLVLDIHKSLVNAMKDGTGFEEWRKNIKPTLQSYGWLGQTEVINPRTGEIATINVDSYRLQQIFQTNIQTVQAKAHYDELMEDEDAEYWRVVTFGDQDVRESHAKLYSQFIKAVRHKNDAFWNDFYPKKAGAGWWGCRCEVETYTLREVHRFGWTILTPVSGKRKNPFSFSNFAKIDDTEVIKQLKKGL